MRIHCLMLLHCAGFLYSIFSKYTMYASHVDNLYFRLYKKQAEA